jgi:hypothetical protein
MSPTRSDGAERPVSTGWRRHNGFPAGVLLAGRIADLWGLTTAIGVVAVLTAGSGLLVAPRMYETRSVLGTGR